MHAENGDAVVLGQDRIYKAGITAPVGHALSRPAVLEAEATQRAIRLASFIDVPLYVVHVTCEEAMIEATAFCKMPFLCTTRVFLDSPCQTQRSACHRGSSLCWALNEWRQNPRSRLQDRCAVCDESSNTVPPFCRNRQTTYRSPVSRGDTDKEALRKALVGNVLELVGTDHAVFNSTQKAAGRHDFRKIPME